MGHEVRTTSMRTVQLLLLKRYITSAMIRDGFGVSPATAKRYMLDLERTFPVVAEIGKGKQRILRLPA